MTELINKKDGEILNIEGKELKVTHLDKVFWPDEGYTKGDLIDYYIKISKYILPYLRERPESLLRYPNGIKGKSFYQKNIDHLPPDWVKTVAIESEEKNEIINYMIINDLLSLIYAINLGCIDINPWNSKEDNLENPDYLIIDLDPEDIDFKYVSRAALAVKRTLDELGITGYPKTSGATGIHIYVPTGGKYSYEKVRTFANIIVKMSHQKAPDFTSLERSPKNRQQKVYLDWLQNARGQTLAAPYCVRPRPKATVSTPLDWNEVNDNLSPNKFTIKNIFDRLNQKPDLFKGVLDDGINLESLLEQQLS